MAMMKKGMAPKLSPKRKKKAPMKKGKAKMAPELMMKLAGKPKDASGSHRKKRRIGSV